MASESAEQTAFRLAALHYSLSKAPIFSGLPEGDLQRIARYSRIRTLRKGSFLFRQGDAVIGFYVVRRGLIHVSRINPEGGESVIHLLHPGESFAERAILTGEGYPANARTMEDSEVILIPAEEFKQHQKERPDLAWRMVSSMSHHLRSLVTALEGLRITDAEKRVIHWILRQCPATNTRKPVDIPLEISQTELAAELAIRRETLSRILRKLSTAGYITWDRRSLRVLNVGALRLHFDLRP